MTITIATAPGKAILLGEHAVVYGRPAIAVPLAEIEARAEFIPAAAGQGVLIQAEDLGRRYRLSGAAEDDGLAAAIRLTLATLEFRTEPDVTVRISSTVPMARGLGSGTAVSTAIIRGLAEHLGHPLPPAALSNLVYEIEKIHHGTPSGIDNTVIAFAQPVYFVRGQPLQRLAVGAPLTLVIGDSGVASPTRAAVGDLRRRWQADPERYEGYFDEVGVIVEQARRALEAGNVPALGQLMVENQEILKTLDLSSPELDRLIEAARRAGALGAKLSGAGRGGNMIALVRDGEAAAVVEALREAGAVNTLVTTVA